MCQKAFRSPDSHSLCRLRFRGLFLHSGERAATRKSGAPPVNYGSFSPAGIPPATHSKPRDGKPLFMDTCTKVKRSCILAVNSGLKEREFSYLCRLDASEPDPKLYILQLCVSASSCFLFSPLLPLTSFWPFLSFALSLSPSLNTCVSLLVWQLKTLLW